MQHFLLVVEGPHDVEFTGRILKHMGYNRLRNKSEIDQFWYNTIPSKFPYGNDLEERVPVPVFYGADGRFIAVKSAVGIRRLVDEALSTMKVLDEDLTGIGFLLDADTKMAAVQYQNLSDLVKEKLKIDMPGVAGKITPSVPRYGAFIFPDNATPGTLENVLSDCAEASYSALFAKARKFVGDINRNELNTNELRGLNKYAGVTKAALGCAATVLKPGQTIQASIRSDRWLDNNMDLPIVKRSVDFVSGIING